MKPAGHIVVILLVSVFIFNSCKNDLKLNAPYKEIPSIYAVLNPQDRIQMIRINKVFLGAGDANVMAKIADSVNYQPGEITITLNRINEYGVKDLASVPVGATAGKQTITFRDSVVQADDGAFSKTQRVYVSSDKLFTGGTYYLTVKNNTTGNVFTAKSAAIDSVKGNQGIRPFTTNPVYPYPPGTSPSEYIDYVSNNGGSVRYAPGASSAAVLYQLNIRFHFYDSLYNHQKTYNYVDYTFGNQNVSNANPYLVSSFKEADVFQAIGIGLSQMNLNTQIYGRKMYKIEYFIYSTTQDYLDYTQYLTPSLSIDQSKPLYSNFDNQAALGLFTFRTRCSINKEMSTTFVSEFSRNSYTCAYKFYTASFQLQGCGY